MQFKTTALFFLSAVAPALAAEVGATGVINGMDGGLQGTISVADENTLRITQYTLQDASAPALHWWGSTTENLGSGFRINNERVTTTASDQTISIALDAGYTADKFTYVGLWCERLNQNFGQAKLDRGGSTSGNASTTSSGSASATSAMSGATTKTGSYAAGALAAAAAFAALMI